MHVERITSVAGVCELAPSWARLMLRAGVTMPFHTFAWSAARWRHFAQDKARVRDPLAVRTVWDNRGRTGGCGAAEAGRAPGDRSFGARWLLGTLFCVLENR